MRDIGSSFFYLCMLQTASTIFSLLLTLVAYIFFAYGTDNARAITQGTAWPFVAFVIFLPALGVLAWTFSRREQALKAVSRIKSISIWVYLAHRDWVAPECLPDGHLAAVQQTLFNILGEMRGYLLPPRYYSTTFPYTGVRHKMMTIAQERAKYIRRIVSNFKKLSQYNEPLRRAGLDSAGICKLSEFYHELHSTFEDLANIKEYRTPLPLRVLTRFYMTVVIPLFFAPYYVSATTSNAFNLCFAIIMNLAMLALLNASIILEDPFDNQGLDGIYIDEPLSECEQMINMDEDHELELAVHESLGGALGTSLMKSTALPDDSRPPTVPHTPHTQSQDYNEMFKSQAKASEIVSHEVVDVHVEDPAASGSQYGQPSHKHNFSGVSVEAQNMSGSDHSDLGLGQCFVMPPASPDDAPNYDSVAMTENTVVNLDEDLEAGGRTEEFQDAVDVSSDKPIVFFDKP